MAENRFAVIGLGKFGRAIARKLSDKGAEVVGIDMNETNVERIQEEIALCICMDATDKKALISQNIADVDAVVVSIGENFEALLLCTVYLQELNVKRVIARANDEHQRRILEKMGVEEILSPEDEVGNVIAEKLMHPSVVSILQLPEDYEIAEIKAPKGIQNRNLADINLRDKYKINLVTIERELEKMVKGQKVCYQHIIGIPTPETVIEATDTVVLFGTTKDIERFLEINK
ncbi:MAG: TrkA family potassium uptake protein [Vicingaceae bacterium]